MKNFEEFFLNEDSRGAISKTSEIIDCLKTIENLNPDMPFVSIMYNADCVISNNGTSHQPDTDEEIIIKLKKYIDFLNGN